MYMSTFQRDIHVYLTLANLPVYTTPQKCQGRSTLKFPNEPFYMSFTFKNVTPSLDPPLLNIVTTIVSCDDDSLVKMMIHLN